MSRIVLFKGESQYEVVRIFIDNIAEAFNSLGYEAVIIDLTKNGWQQELQNVFGKPCDFVFSFNAIGIEIASGNKSLYDILESPLMTMLVDHPIYQLERLAIKTENAIIGCVDRTHISFIEKFYKNSKSCAFIPHGGSVCKDTNQTQDRDIDILFGGSVSNPDDIRKNWKGMPKVISELFDDMVDLIIDVEETTLEGALDTVLKAKGLYADAKLFFDFSKYLLWVDGYIRKYRRVKCIEVLSEAGYKIECYGNGWEKLNLLKKDNVKINGNVDYNKMLSLMSRSKVVLNVLPAFVDGSHERVFSGMLNGAVCVSDSNKYLCEEFKDMEDAVFYSWKRINELPDKIGHVLSNTGILSSIAEQGKLKAQNKHMWVNRAQQVISLSQIYKALYSNRNKS